MQQLQAAPVVVGLVLTLRGSPLPDAPSVQTLCERHDLTPGRAERHWFAAAACTADPKALHRALETDPAIAQVDVVFVQLADECDQLPALSA